MKEKKVLKDGDSVKIYFKNDVFVNVKAQDDGLGIIIDIFKDSNNGSEILTEYPPFWFDSS